MKSRAIGGDLFRRQRTVEIVEAFQKLDRAHNRKIARWRLRLWAFGLLSLIDFVLGQRFGPRLQVLLFRCLLATIFGSSTLLL